MSEELNTATETAATKDKRPPVVVEKVTMEDGRIAEFAGKRRLLKDEVVVAQSLPLGQLHGR